MQTEKYDITKESEIFLGNLIIAQYDGWMRLGETKFGKGYMFEKDGDIKFHIDFDYNSNWSSIMPVVEKIAKEKFEDYQTQTDSAFMRTFGMMDMAGNMLVRINRHRLFYEKDLITATWKAVVDFIEAHNRTQNENK